MAKFTWQDGTLVSKAKVEIDGTIYEVDPEEYSGTTPLSASNLNAMQDGIYEDIDGLSEEVENKTEKNIITLASNGGGTISATNKIPLNTIIGQVGTKLTANTSTYRIVVGSGVTHILITAQAQGYTSDNNTCQIAIYKNGVATMKSYQTKSNYATMPISPYVIDVEEDDYFELYVISGSLNVSSGLGNANLCYITVEAID